MELLNCPFCGGEIGRSATLCGENYEGKWWCNKGDYNTLTPDPLAEKVVIEAGYFAAFACDDWETHECNNCRLKRAIDQYQKEKGITP